MDYRKLIKFGDNSFVVSLPKPWLSKHRLEKGNIVYLSENGNNELILTAQERNDLVGERELLLDFDQEQNFEGITRKLFSKYIAGYDIFTVRGEKTIQEHGERIRALLSQLLAFEIVEETKNKLVLKDYIDARAVSIETTIRRIDILLRSMLDDLKYTFREDSENLARRDKEINKLSLLALRTINKAMHNPSLQHKIGIKTNEFLKVWNLFNTLEPIADEAKNISRSLGTSKASRYDVDEFFQLYDAVCEDYKNVMKSWYTADEKVAYTIADNVPLIIERCDSLLKRKKDIPLSHAIAKLKTMETLIKNIARSIYDV